MKARAKIGKTEWETAIWYDTKRKAYLLPLKTDIRRKEGLDDGMNIKVTIWI